MESELILMILLNAGVSNIDHHMEIEIDLESLQDQQPSQTDLEKEWLVMNTIHIMLRDM